MYYSDETKQGILGDLLNSDLIIDGHLWRKCVSEEQGMKYSGLYMLYPKFNINYKSQEYLKVGRTIAKNGLWDRIKSIISVVIVIQC